MTEFRAVVTDIREERRIAGKIRWQLQLDPTGFTPGDVGRISASSKSGAHLAVPVLSVTRDATGEIWHTVEKPLATGTEITAHVEPRPLSNTRPL